MNDNDEITYLIEHDEYYKTFLISVISPKTMTGREFAKSLKSLLIDIEQDPDQFFESFVATTADKH